MFRPSQKRWGAEVIRLQTGNHGVVTVCKPAGRSAPPSRFVKSFSRRMTFTESRQVTFIPAVQEVTSSRLARCRRELVAASDKAYPVSMKEIGQWSDALARAMYVARTRPQWLANEHPINPATPFKQAVCGSSRDARRGHCFAIKTRLIRNPMVGTWIMPLERRHHG